MLTPEIKALLKRQGYKIAGSHGAVKPCGWFKKSLFNKGVCYKQKFYGIESHRCVQCTPAVAWCAHKCEFCWRAVEHTLGESFEQQDNPKFLADEIIRKHKEFLTGYPGAEGIDKKKLAEALNPTQVALSLSGEPTAYKRLGELVNEFHGRGMTTFVVTNGTNPESLKSMTYLPTQLYITLPAPNKQVYEATCNPLIKDGWERINKSLSILSKLKTRRVVRLTLVKGMNMLDPRGYAELIRKADPDFVEPKAFMSVGFARRRIPYEQMPLHNEIRGFSEKLASELGWSLIDEQPESRVCLIASQDPEWRLLNK